MMAARFFDRASIQVIEPQQGRRRRAVGRLRQRHAGVVEDELDVRRFDYLLVESAGISEPLPVAEPRLGRRTVLTFPLLAPPQKN